MTRKSNSPCFQLTSKSNSLCFLLQLTRKLDSPCFLLQMTRKSNSHCFLFKIDQKVEFSLLFVSIDQKIEFSLLSASIYAHLISLCSFKIFKLYFVSNSTYLEKPSNHVDKIWLLEMTTSCRQQFYLIELLVNVEIENTSLFVEKRKIFLKHAE